MFQRAVKQESKLRLAIAGPSGSGKTYTALALASQLGSRVAVVDTEHGSASKYADLFAFDVVNMHAPYHPNKYVEAIDAAVSAGYDVLVLDSTSHAWNGSGGMLELVEQASKRYKGNSYAAWGDVTPLYQRMVDAIVTADIHIIATARSKQDYILVEKAGKQTPQKVGMAPVQRDGFEYEFDVFLDMDIENNAIVQKTRCPALAGAVIARPGAELAATLREWLGGAPRTLHSERTQDAPAASRASNGHVGAPTPPPADDYAGWDDLPSASIGYQVGDAVMVAGKNDEKPGTVTAIAGDLVQVSVNGKVLKVNPDRLTLIMSEEE